MDQSSPDSPTPVSHPATKQVRKLLTWLLLLVGIGVLLWQAQRFTSAKWLFYDDYIEYWSAVNLNLKQGNPYSPQEIGALQYSLGRTERIPLMMWNPPWTLALFTPLGLLPYAPSRLLWYLICLFLLFVCVSWLWKACGGPHRFQWIAWLIGFSFGPALEALKLGQVGILMLASAVGFLYFIRREKGWAAGAVLALATIKPHILYLPLLAALGWALLERRWKVIAGFGIALLIAVGIAWLPNPALMSQYLYATTVTPPAEWNTPTLGGILRTVLGAEKFWLQFVPPFSGAVWLLWYGLRQRKSWEWGQQLPLLVAVSMATAAYGWVFDQTVLLAAFIPLSARLFVSLFVQKEPFQRPAVGILLAAYLALDAIAIGVTLPQHWFWWMPGSFLLWYLFARRYFPNPRSPHEEKKQPAAHP